MKLSVVLIFFLSSLFGGGGVGSIDIITKYEKQDIKDANHCETCGEPAKLLPYNGEDIPEAQTYPCPPVDKKGCIVNIGT
jgi:hypothetical protein